jgi:single-stranded-DNA-specific exonuclease
MEAGRVPEFRQRFEAHAAAALRPEDLIPELTLDAEVALADLGPELLAGLDRLAPFGHGNSEPLLLLRGLKVISVGALGASGRHFKIGVEQGAARGFLKLWDYGERMTEFAAGTRLDAAIRLEADSYSGWAATAKDIRQAIS